MQKRLKALLLVAALWQFSFGLFAPIYALFVEGLSGEIGGTLLSAGIAWAIMGFVYATLQFPMGKLADRHGKKGFLFAGLLMEGSLFFFLAFISQVWELFVLEVFLGIASAASTPAYDALYSRSLDEGKEAQEWGLWEMVYGYSVAFSALIGAAIASVFGFANLFLVIALMSFAAAVAVWATVKEEHFARFRAKKLSKLSARSRRN